MKKPKDYIVIDAPFYDGVQLHDIGATVRWAGPAGRCLHPAESGPPPVAQIQTPIFPNPLSGRGDGVKVAGAPKSPASPAIVLQ